MMFILKRLTNQVKIGMRDKMPVEVKCNICDCGDHKSYENITGHKDIVQCNQCAIVFTKTAPHQDTLMKELLPDGNEINDQE